MEHSKGRSRQGYLQVLLGKDALQQPVWEYVHRLLLWIYVGPSHARDCMHLCDEPRCCCPKHLWWGSRGSNVDGSYESYMSVVASSGTPPRRSPPSGDDDTEVSLWRLAPPP